MIPVPNGALVEKTGWGTQALIRWMNAVTRSLGGEPTSGSIWRGKTVRVAEVGAGSALPVVLGFNVVGIGFGLTYTVASGTTGLSTQYRLQASVAAGATAGWSVQTAMFWLGNAAARGGFRIESVFGVSTASAGGRAAFGLFTGAPISLNAVDPSTFVNCVFIGCDAGDANFQVMCNDAAGACSKVDLGASFAKATTDAVYRWTLEADANATEIAYSMERVDVDPVVSVAGTLTTDLPVNTSLMSPQWAFGGGTGPNFGCAFMRLVAESPY